MNVEAADPRHCRDHQEECDQMCRVGKVASLILKDFKLYSWFALAVIGGGTLTKKLVAENE
jgi:hypothetical protein